MFFQVTKKLTEIKESLSSSVGGQQKIKHFIILNENRPIEPVDISINLCDLEL